MPKLLADQDILIYPAPSRSVLRKDGTNLISQLEEKYPGDWAKRVRYLPFMMKIRVYTKNGLKLHPSQIIVLRQEIQTIVNDLPEITRGNYSPILDELKESTPETMTIPRSIEYLTMVCARYVFDSIRSHDESLPQVNFSGLTMPARNLKGQDISEVWIFHNHQSSAIDYLLIECQLLAVEKIRAIMSLRNMRFLAILRRKCQKFKPVGLAGRRRGIPFFRGRI